MKNNHLSLYSDDLTPYEHISLHDFSSISYLGSKFSIIVYLQIFHDQQWSIHSGLWLELRNGSLRHSYIFDNSKSFIEEDYTLIRILKESGILKNLWVQSYSLKEFYGFSQVYLR